jgi:hypothetical protein
LCQFFFSHRKRIHFQYRKFYESEDETNQNDETSTEDTPQMAASESAARFYFQLTYSLAKEDLTKFDRINEMNIYLCLNTASMMKDRIIQQQNELKAIQNQPKEVR